MPLRESLLGALFGNESIVVRLLLITVSGLVLYRWRGVHDTHSVVLFLLLIPTIYQFRGLERRMVADGFYYYSYVQSFWKDHSSLMRTVNKSSASTTRVKTTSRAQRRRPGLYGSRLNHRSHGLPRESGSSGTMPVERIRKSTPSPCSKRRLSH